MEPSKPKDLSADKEAAGHSKIVESIRVESAREGSETMAYDDYCDWHDNL